MYQFAEFNQKFDEYFFSFLDTQQNHYHELLPHPNLKQYFKTIRAAATGGKRVRPYVAWICLDKPIDQISEAEWNIIIAIEIIHLFALIHDDLMDQSPTRRGVPTVHTAISSTLMEQAHQGDLAFGGRMLAMLAGDIVFWSASTLLATTAVSMGPEKYKKIHDRFTLLVDGVVLGQALDFDQAFRPQVSAEEVQTKTIHKTGHYTFSYPMQIGGILANYNENQVQSLYGLGEKIGLGFQIQDDILDITGDPEKTQKPIMADISNGQHTLLTAYIRENGTEEQKKSLEYHWRKQVTAESMPILRELYISSGAIMYAQNLVKKSYDDAITLIDTSELSTNTKTNLISLIEYLANREH